MSRQKTRFKKPTKKVLRMSYRWCDHTLENIATSSSYSRADRRKALGILIEKVYTEGQQDGADMHDDDPGIEVQPEVQAEPIVAAIQQSFNEVVIQP